MTSIAYLSRPGLPRHPVCDPVRRGGVAKLLLAPSVMFIEVVGALLRDSRGDGSRSPEPSPP